MALVKGVFICCINGLTSKGKSGFMVGVGVGGATGAAVGVGRTTLTVFSRAMGFAGVGVEVGSFPQAINIKQVNNHALKNGIF
jgi:hypothetical protein